MGPLRFATTDLGSDAEETLSNATGPRIANARRRMNIIVLRRQCEVENIKLDHDAF
jgi:hypothetical protein